jgi:hypothetical protein
MKTLKMWNRHPKAAMRVKYRTDPSASKISPSDDGFHLSTPEIGDFEWWYFDIYYPDTNCTLKVVAHLGTDPLRRRFYPQLVVSISSPTEKQTFIKVYALDDFTASTDFCDVRLSNELHAYVDPSNKANLYHISVNVDGLKANLDFDGCLEGCKPIGAEVKAEKGNKEGTFFWAIPLPKAKVTGDFSIGTRKYAIREGLGYHDHNYWKVGCKHKLFMDDIISKWYWGRCFAEDYTIIFMDTYCHGEQIKSLVVAKGNNAIHCSNGSIDVSVSDFKKDGQLNTSYPARIMIESIVENEPFQMILQSKGLTDRRDLLEDINPIARWLIRFFVSKPAYFGLLADGTIRLANNEIKGTALYEMMYFRSHHAKE